MIRNTSITDFEKTVNYCIALCGFPSLNTEKFNTLYNFMRDQHGSNTIEEFQNAFTALAAGRLDEKLESIKSLSGLTASRVLQSYLRSQHQETAPKVEMKDGKERSYMNDENRKLIFDKFGRWVKFDDEINEAEHNYLMEYWMNENKKYFKETHKMEVITSTAFDYLEKNGSLRVSNGMLQYYQDRVYKDLVPWTQIEDGAIRLKYNEDMAINKSKQNDFMRLTKHLPGISIQDAQKRYAVSVYYEAIN